MDDNLDDLKSLLKSLTPKDGEKCVYCGLLASDKEHVIPISWIEQMEEMKKMGFDVEVPKEEIVPACRECNLIATDFLFKDFKEKRKFISEKLIRKYRKFYNFKLWKDEEVMELSGRLREQVFYFNEIAKVIKKRLGRISRNVK